MTTDQPPRRRLKRDGIVIADTWALKGREEGKRWYARAWDARRRKYRCKAWETFEQAETWAKDEQAKLTLGLSSAGSVSLSAVAEAYTDDLTRRGRTDAHVVAVKRVLQGAVQAGITDLKADDIKDRVRRWLAAAKKGAGEVEISARTRNGLLVILKGCAHFALGEGMLHVDPLAGLRRETDASAVRLREVFSPQELALMVSDARTDGEDWPIALMLVYAGMRMGEAYAARWSWFDWGGKVINIRQEDDFSPKRHQERQVPMLQELHDALKPMGHLQGKLTSLDLESAANRSRRFIQYLEKCGVKSNGRGAHCVRHSWVSLRLALGVTSLIVQRQTGHRTITTTQEYTHVVPAGWIDSWPHDGKGEFYLRREPNASIAQAPVVKPKKGKR